MLCLHYYSSYVTLHFDEDDDEYRIDQIQEFARLGGKEWKDVVAEHVASGYKLLCT